MKRSVRSIVKKRTSERWANLAITAIFLFNFIIFGYAIVINPICQPLAFDYCAFWGAGRIINENNFSDVYNLDFLRQYQSKIYPQAKDATNAFTPVEIPYLPTFVLPFPLLSLFNLTFSYLLWTAINIIGFILYLRFFSKEVSGQPLSLRFTILIFLSLPVFVNLFEGQLNIWLAICAGEFMRALFSDKPFKAGLWIGGWLLKPQLLVLLIPFILFQRSIKSFLGFITSAIGISAVSLILVDWGAIIDLKNIILTSAGGGATSAYSAMMNWRMLGYHIEKLSTPIIGKSILIIGTVLTIAITFYAFKKKISPNSGEFMIALLGIIAATCAATWHAHLHMSIVLIPPMIYLFVKKQLSKKLFLTWIFIPILVQFFGYLFAIYIELKNLSTSTTDVIGFTRGFPGFILNLVLLGWSIRAYYKMNKRQHIKINNTTMEI